MYECTLNNYFFERMRLLLERTHPMIVCDWQQDDDQVDSVRLNPLE